jgi:hypothetical protein
MSSVVSINDMRRVSLKELKELAYDAKYGLWEKARRYDRDVKLYLHWTAGAYHQFWDSYHVQIDSDGSIYIQDGVGFDTVLNGIWMRNSGSVGITLLGCFDATTSQGLGTNPPTAAQIESMSMVVAVLSNALDLTIDKQRVLTHGEAADNEDGYWGSYGEDELYGPNTTCTRWDLEYLGTADSPVFDPTNTEGKRGGDIIRGKAAWYSSQYPDGVENHM